MNCWIGLGPMTIRAVNKFNTIFKLGSLYQPVNGLMEIRVIQWNLPKKWACFTCTEKGQVHPRCYQKGFHIYAKYQIAILGRGFPFMSNVARSHTNPKRPNMCKLSNSTCRDTNQVGNQPWLLSTRNNDANACTIILTWSEKGTFEKITQQ